jgi:hypothetical protein
VDSRRQTPGAYPALAANYHRDPRSETIDQPSGWVGSALDWKGSKPANQGVTGILRKQWKRLSEGGTKVYRRITTNMMIVT